MSRLFLLSPADTRGRRAQILFNPAATFDLACRLRGAGGATLGEVFSFLSGLYFRGKLTYARAFAGPAPLVIVPGEGLLPADTPVDRARVMSFAGVPVDARNPHFVGPLVRDARRLEGPIVLLGSIASGKYVDPLLEIFGERLLFPATFVGRGDMSRGGVLLRAVDEARELDYVPVMGSARHGVRPPKLAPRSPRA